MGLDPPAQRGLPKVRSGEARISSQAATRLLIGRRSDPHIERLGPRLGPAVALLDPTDLGDGAWLRLEQDRPGLRLGAALLGPMERILVRSFETGPGGLSGSAASTRAREWHSLSMCWLWAQQAAGCAVANPPQALDQHHFKLAQLARLRAHGLPVPRSLGSDDPAALRSFAQGREVVFKPLAGGARCHLLQPEDLTPARLATLSAAPALFQERVHGPVLRSCLLEGRLLVSWRIESDALDYRGHERAVRVTTLDSAESALLKRVPAALGLRFCGVDWIRSETGPVLLEANPAPMWAGFEDAAGAGQPVTEALAGWLNEPG